MPKNVGAWARGADKHKSVASEGPESLPAAPFRDCSALAVSRVWCGAAAFPCEPGLDNLLWSGLKITHWVFFPTII